MQHLDTLWKVINAAGQVRDIAQETKKLIFNVTLPTTLYIHTEYAHVVVAYHDLPEIHVESVVQAGFGWRMQTDQDAAGVYLVAKRRSVIGTMSKAKFRVWVPRSTYVVMRLESASYTVEEVTQQVQLAPLV